MQTTTRLTSITCTLATIYQKKHLIQNVSTILLSSCCIYRKVYHVQYHLNAAQSTNEPISCMQIDYCYSACQQFFTIMTKTCQNFSGIQQHCQDVNLGQINMVNSHLLTSLCSLWLSYQQTILTLHAQINLTYVIAVFCCH